MPSQHVPQAFVLASPDHVVVRTLPQPLAPTNKKVTLSFKRNSSVPLSPQSRSPSSGVDQTLAANILSEPSNAPQNCQIANTRRPMISTLTKHNPEQDLSSCVTPTNNSQNAERPSIATTATVSQSDSNIKRYSAQFHKNGLPIKSALKSRAAVVDSSANASTLCRPSSLRAQSSPASMRSPKYVHFNTQLEHIRLFLQGEMPSCVSERETIADARQQDHPTSDIKLSLSNWSPVSIDTVHPFGSETSTPVRLEDAVLSEDQLEIEGSVLVQNIAFHKHVSVRFTVDFWQTQSEVVAEFDESIQGTVDRFSFVIPLNLERASIEKTFCLAVRYQVNGREFWDSNNDMNYHIECKRVVVASSSTVPDLAKRMNTLIIGSPLSSDFSKPVLKKQANRYDFSTSLSAARSGNAKTEPLLVTNAPASHTAYRPSEYIMPPSPSPQNYHHTLYASSPKFVHSYLSAASPPDHFHLGYDQLSLDRTMGGKKAARDSWSVEVDPSSALNNRQASFSTGLYGPYSSSPKGSAPITIPSPKAQMTKRPAVGSSSYFDLVERYCFYESSPNLSPYNSYSNSPPAPCIRG
jgi:hypothetical protein